jgi:hypothetical protein
MCKLVVAISFILLTLFSPISQALGSRFDPARVIPASELSALPSQFNSVEAIQSYLKSRGSFLADLQVSIDFDPEDDILEQKDVRENIAYLRGKRISVAQMVWEIARGRLGNGCSITARQICVNNSVEPLNPAFILAKIQKESGLIYGKNSKLNPNSADAAWLIDRATGYLCTELGEQINKEDSCFDENSEWKFYKGLFRQVYYGIRLLRLVAKRCEVGGSFAYPNSKFVVGNTISAGNYDSSGRQYQDTVLLGDPMTCSLYVYTPHIFAQKLFYCTWKQVQYQVDCDADIQATTSVPVVSPPPASTLPVAVSSVSVNSSSSSSAPVPANNLKPNFTLENGKKSNTASSSTVASSSPSVANSNSSSSSSSASSSSSSSQAPLPTQLNYSNLTLYSRVEVVDYTSTLKESLKKGRNIRW